MEPVIFSTKFFFQIFNFRAELRRNRAKTRSLWVSLSSPIDMQIYANLCKSVLSYPQKHFQLTVSVQFQSNFHFSDGAVSEQFQSDSGAIYVTVTEQNWGSFWMCGIVWISDHLDGGFPEQFQSSFRAVSEQFQSNFRAISEQFQSSFRAIFKRSFRSVSEYFQISFRAISEQF